jgi:hypothetical protein
MEPQLVALINLTAELAKLKRRLDYRTRRRSETTRQPQTTIHVPSSEEKKP